MIILPHRIDLIKLFPNSIGAEIGVAKGHFSFEILEQAGVAKLYCIDPWSGAVPNEPQFTEEQHQKNEAEARHVLRGHTNRVTILKEPSLEAVRRFEEGSLDWVYIDAAHDYVSVMDDLVNWAWRLKSGGALMGHDYCKTDFAQQHGFGVIGAVTDFCKNFGWELTYLTDEEYASFLLRPKVWHGAEL